MDTDSVYELISKDEDEYADEPIDFEDTPEFNSNLKSLKSILKNGESNTKLISIFESLLAITNLLAILLQHNYENELTATNDLNILKGNDLKRYNLIKSSSQDRYRINVATVTLVIFDSIKRDKQKLTADEENKKKIAKIIFENLK